MPEEKLATQLSLQSIMFEYKPCQQSVTRKITPLRKVLMTNCAVTVRSKRQNSKDSSVRNHQFVFYKLVINMIDCTFHLPNYVLKSVESGKHMRYLASILSQRIYTASVAEYRKRNVAIPKCR